MKDGVILCSMRCANYKIKMESLQTWGEPLYNKHLMCKALFAL